jgi:hypothetical protein
MDVIGPMAPGDGKQNSAIAQRLLARVPSGRQRLGRAPPTIIRGESFALRRGGDFIGLIGVRGRNGY